MSKTRDGRRRAPAALLFGALAMAGLGGVATGLIGGVPEVRAQTWASTTSPEDLRYRLDTLDAELAEIRARLGDTAAATNPGSAAAALSNSRVNQLEGEIRRLTATVEELQHHVRRIAEEAARRFSDVEFRLTELEGGDVTTLQPVPPLGGVAETPAPEPAASGVPPGAQEPAQQSTAVRPPASGIVSGPTGQGTFAGVEVPLPGQENGQQVAAAPAVEQGDLDRAIQDVRQGRFDQAEERLRRFLNENPDSPLKPAAWYWLGESQFVRGNHADAARSFLNGYQADTIGSRAAHNLYRLGVTLGRLGQIREACSTLREVRNRFPSTPDGIAEQADAESDALACG
jgi:tol-pal system protein YbgF